MADDIAKWLDGLGLGQYAQAFTENDIDLEVLSRVTDDDLMELGLTIGHRRKLQAAIEVLVGGAPPTREAVSPSLDSAPDSAGAERRQLTVMFCDLVGSTALSTRLDPEDMRELLGRYQGACSDVITRYDGYVAKFMGDGVYAYFGYPRAHEDDAERAINAGLGIVEALDSLPDDLQVRIGIATGIVAVGDIVGEGAAEEANVVGEAPNLAARLQALAEPNSVVIGDSTRSLIGGLFETMDLGLQDLKGFNEPMSAWSVVRAVRAESRFDVMRAAGMTPLVGREEELDILLRRWQRAAYAEGQMALISGEPGIGKSRLIHALQESIVDEPHTPVRLQCSPFHTNSALYPMIDYLERAADLAPRDDHALKLKKLEALLRLSGDRIDDVAPLVADLLSIDTEGSYPPLQLSPQEKKQRTLQVMAGRLLALSSMQRPLLLVLEDAHWIDPTTLEFMELIVESVHQSPVLIVITYRPEFDAPWIGRSRVTLLALNRLDHGACARMVKEVVANRVLPEELREQIIARTDGVPLFVEELTRSILETGQTTDSQEGRSPSGRDASFQIPATLMDSLEARIDRLDQAKEVAQLGAVIGRSFDYELISNIFERTDTELDDALSRLIDSELVSCRGEPPTATYTFKHALIEDAAYGSMLRGRREDIHAKIAQALGHALVQENSVEPEVIAHHYTESRQFASAAAYWLRAGEDALNRFALQEAEAHLGRGLEVIDHTLDGPDRPSIEEALHATLGVTFRSAKGPGHEDGERALARAYELGGQREDSVYRFPVLFGLWQVHYSHAQHGQAVEESKELVKISEKGGDRQEVLAANWAHGMTLMLMGDNEAGLRCYHRMRGLYDAESDRPLAFKYMIEFGVGMCWIASTALFSLGYPDQALQVAREAVSRGRAQLPVHLGGSLIYGAHVPICRGESATALEWADECIAAEQHGMRFHLGFAKVNRGWALVELGQFDEGITDIQEGAQIWRNSGYESWLPRHTILLSQANTKAGHFEESLELAETALFSTRQTGERQFEGPALIARGQALAALNRTVEAEHSLTEAIDIARAQSAKSWELRAATSLAGLWHSQGKTTEARDLLAPVYGWFTEGFDTADLKEAKALLEELS